ncbi:uncharacterized protein DUF1572 [Mongoliibacter ruber]|uniref:Uncharacterized protein DUF1572 n=2 Tax=Mongoliibacter ruber TaxID=1750599 RepID=A0A2T0WVT2_9BACT|nr:uncharacterized protein DUF1572 [Mongoliibacter ruber]
MEQEVWELNLEINDKIMKDALIYFFERDLKKLIKELDAYQNEENIWRVSGEIKNSTGNLSLHLVGNLNHYIGVHLGKSAYSRDREAEFATKGISRTDLIVMTENTIQEITNAILQFPEDWFSRTYPEDVFNESMTYEHFMIHLVSHLNYHLGQVNYHRRLLDH